MFATPTRNALWITLLLALSSTVALAAEPPAEACRAALPFHSLALPAAEGLDTPEAALLGAEDDSQSEGFHVTQCWDGSTVGCLGTNASGVNSNCPTQQGYCDGSTGRRWCPPCPVVYKSITIQCQDGTSRTCWGTGFVLGQNAVCFAGQSGYCWGNGSGSQYCPSCPILP